ncbi:MAG: hypothetical protein IJF18_00625 [Oscillospiraceae bacterium]|nr:hypothetical protein [Oscillospiraceae bacterium]
MGRIFGKGDNMTGLKKLISLASAAALALSMCTVSVSASEAYDPYNYDRWGDAISSQAGYTADGFVDGNTIGCGTMNEPADIFVSHDDLVYIVDKGNNRIIVTDLEFNLVKVMEDFKLNGESSPLKKPTGIFVDRFTDLIYIADNENGRVIKCDTDGNILKEFGRPESELYDAELTYNPNKVLVDKAGNVYIVVRSVTKGAVMYNSDGKFLGFYGANRVEQTAEVLANAFWNLISTDEQRERTAKNTPIGFTNFDIDELGFIYTVTESTETTTDLVKKLNPRGDNILDSLGAADMTFGDIPPAYYSIYAKNSSLTDIDLGPNGELNILDFQHGRIFQYDKECWLLFIMGGTGEQLGTFRSATAIESHDDKLYVVDSRKNGVTIFTRTTFGEIVTEAANLYNDGKYEESLEPWKSVLKYDGNYRRAYIGIGNALFNRFEYKEAMEYFEISISRGRYSRAFEGYRDEWLKENFTAIMITIIVVVVAFLVLGHLKKKGKLKFLKGGA